MFIHFVLLRIKPLFELPCVVQKRPTNNNTTQHNNKERSTIKMMTAAVAAVLAISIWPNRRLPLEPTIFVGKLRS